MKTLFVRRALHACFFLGSLFTANQVAAEAVIQSKSHVVTYGQLCGVGPAPNCTTNVLFEEAFTATKHGGDLHVSRVATSGDTPSGNVTVSGEANLGTGTVRVVAKGSDISGATGANQGAYAFASGSASLGDTFTLHNTDGTTYVGSGMSTMRLGIDGILSGSSDSDLSLVISIGIYRTGYFDAVEAGDWATAAGLKVGYVSTGWLTADDLLPDSLALDFSMQDLLSFEWQVDVWASFAFRQDPDGHKFAIADLGHTIAVGFDGPEGTYVTSASGLFPGAGPGTNPVPEPGSLALLGIAAAGFRFSRQR
jgi:hypothetical protein